MPNGDPLQEYREENAQLREENKRLLKAREIASYNIIELTTQRDMMAKCLANALGLVSTMMDDLRHAGVSPSMASVVGKTKLDYETRQLLQRYGTTLDSPEDVTPS